MTTANDPIPWHRLHHAYGTADDVPGLLGDLRSDDVEVRGRAHYQLRGNVYHQGTRWEASAYAVPLLVELADSTRTPDRPLVVDLLRLVGVGDLDDRYLPFAGFPGFDDKLRRRISELLPAFYDGEIDDSGDDFDVMNLADQVWAADAYAAFTPNGEVFRRWLADADPEVAARAAELLTWVPPTSSLLDDLVAVPDGGVVRASANLALGHMSGHDDVVLPRLSAQLTDASPMIRWTAAIAVARRTRPAVPSHVRRMLTDERDPRKPLSVPGWPRPLAGLMALALTPPE
ncbi:MAG: HEAT repeat domain-containing protein [Hamadaea sp.]|uniref:HEAT repeat domain-containing protein n=1 Tax=Hamadaea sp. TaxID=2024425 RepID=UPI0018417C76|nr:hypothetical protein [Hamadaea sp.]NUT20939.1 HEAT repeat domain-containing protein [Hamadaea sp.]